MNNAQKKLATRLHGLLVLPVVLGTAALVLLSTLRQRGALRVQSGTHGSDLVGRAVSEQAIFAAIEGALVTIVIVLSISWVARQLARELGAVVDASEQIGKKHFATRVSVESRLGLERVPEAFNAMAAALEETEESLARANERAREFGERLAHAQSLAAVGQVAASIAHEVGSPLNAILVNARLAAEDEQLPEHAKKSLEAIATQSERIGTILRRMLQLSQPPAEQAGRCDVTLVARDVLSFLDGVLRRAKITSTTELPSTALFASIRADQLQQVLFNLVNNAVQAQPSGGAIVIAARADGDRVCVEVRDAGPGVAEADLPRLWEPFFTRFRERGGTGLGLAVVKHLIERASGEITVGRAPEGGCLFSISLPAAIEPRAGAQPPA
jgi:signal transduction histidine kinase